MIGRYGDLICRRRSFRSFREDCVPPDAIEGLVDFLSELDAPAPDIDWNFDTLPYLDMLRLCSAEPGVRAPHYLLLRAERKSFSLQKCGYLGERAVLYLTEQGIATCWQGSVRIPEGGDLPGSLPFVSAIAFGYSDEPFRSDISEADRRPLKRVAFDRKQRYPSIMELARLAPSSFNRQPCVFAADDRSRIHIFRKEGMLSSPVSRFAQCVDAGAALAHLVCGAEDAGFRAEITRLRPEPFFRRRFVYQASVLLS